MKGGSVLNSRDDVINDDAKLCGKGADKSSTSPLAVNCRLEYAAGAGAIAVIIVALLALGVSISAFALAVLSSLLGYLLAAICLNNPSACEALQKAFYSYFNVPHNESPTYSAKEDALPDANNINQKYYRIPPWHSLRVGRRLNLTLEHFFERLIEHYVESWYKQEISEDNTFLLEIRYQIRYAASMVVTQVKETDCASVILDELAAVLVVHVERIVQTLNEVDECEKKLNNLGALEAKVAAKFSADSHWANRSEANETEYLRALADCLVERLIDETHISGRELDGEVCAKTSSNIHSAWPSHVCRHFLHELVSSTVLKPALDFLTDPDTLNRFLLMAFSSDFDNRGGMENSTMTENGTDESVEFLTNLTLSNQTHVPDSLLALKLNDLVREPRLIQLFDMYLRDVRGPTHLLDCFLQARDIHKRVRSLDKLEDRTRSVVSEIESDAWQLYSGFVHESSPSHIEFLAGVREDFRRAIDEKDLTLLEKATEEVYKRLYQLLNYDYVIPFCQSESYLSYLCGAPPDIEELLRRNAASSAGASSADKFDNTSSAFTLSQFRNKLFSFIGNRSDSSSSLKDSIELRKEGGGGLEELTYSSTMGYNHLYETQRLQSDQNFVGHFPHECLRGVLLQDSGSEIALIDLARDLTKWKITVPNVEVRREAISSKMHFVYVVDVRRYDLDDSKSAAHSDDGAAGRNRRLVSEKAVEEWDHFCHQPGVESGSNEMNALLSSNAAKRRPLPTTVALDSAAVVAPEEDDDSELDRFNNMDDDGDEDILPTTWTTSRKYDEFFVLEEKLRELHGNSLRLTSLPDRKLFMNRNRSLMEAHRPIFERFLQALVEQPILKRSNLLYDFLTLSEGEWMDEADLGQSIMPDLRNPFRVMRQMPNKLARERGQNLKPFILKMLANVLAPPNVQYSTVLMSNSGATVATAYSADAVSRTSGGGISSLASSRPASSAAGCVGIAASGSVSLDSGDSCGSAGFLTEQDERCAVAEELSMVIDAENHNCAAGGEATLDGFLKSNGLYGLLMFVVLRIGQLPAWFEALLIGAERLIKSAANDLLQRRLRGELHDRLLNEETVILVVKALEAALFPDDSNNASSRKSSNTSTAEEKRLRADLALHCLDDALTERVPRWLSFLLQLRFDGGNAATCAATGSATNAESSRQQHHRSGDELRTLARHLFTALQFRRLNRQMVFVALDRMVARLTSGSEKAEVCGDSAHN